MADLQRAQQHLKLANLTREIDTLEGKAVTPAQRLAILDLRLNQVGAKLAILIQETCGFDAKAIRSNGEPWPREKKRAFARLIRAIGGYVPSGAPDTETPADVLDYDAPHFERATQLVTGEALPEDAERPALERWQRAYGT
jgi:hypothetical protein